MLLFFISFLLIVSFFVLNMFVGVVVENFHKCRQQQEEEEARLREEKRQRRLEKKRRSEGGCATYTVYYLNYTPPNYHLNMIFFPSHYEATGIISIYNSLGSLGWASHMT